MPRHALFTLIVSFFVAALLSSPASSENLNTRLQAAYGAGQLPGLHGAIIDLGENRLAEVYFAGSDERWGETLGHVDHNARTLHDLRSVTKSVVGLLYGIALSENKVPAPDAPLYAQFPEYADLADDKERQAIMISHVLSMQMGLEWNEDLPYSDPRNSEIAMERARDRYRFILEQPVREAPGKSWIYSGGATALLARLIEKGTGQTIDDYAAEKLFLPLGISHFEWIAGADGVPSAASGLRLTLPDLAKIGKLVADDGMNNGRIIVPKTWLEESFKPRAEINDFTQYGYLWYLAKVPGRVVAIAVGNGGQRLTVQPKVDLVVASFSGQYNDPESWRTSLSVVLDFANPEAKKLVSR